MKNKKGFTLIELLVVIAIISLLSSIVLVGFREVRKKARDAKRKSELKQLQTAIEAFYTEHEYYPGEGNCAGSRCRSTCWCWNDLGHGGSYIYKDLYEDDLVKKMPVDPVNNFTYYYDYEPWNCYAHGGNQGYTLSTLLESSNSWFELKGGECP